MKTASLLLMILITILPKLVYGADIWWHAKIGETSCGPSEKGSDFQGFISFLKNNKIEFKIENGTEKNGYYQVLIKSKDVQNIVFWSLSFEKCNLGLFLINYAIATNRVIDFLGQKKFSAIETEKRKALVLAEYNKIVDKPINRSEFDIKLDQIAQMDLN